MVSISFPLILFKEALKSSQQNLIWTLTHNKAEAPAESCHSAFPAPPQWLSLEPRLKPLS